MRVMRANMDGSNITTLVVTGLGAEDQKDERKHCVGIAIDHRRRKMYWTQKGAPNSGTGRILRAGLGLPEGEEAVNRMDTDDFLANLPEPIDLEIEAGGAGPYRTDRCAAPEGDTLNRIYNGEDHTAAYGVAYSTGRLNKGTV